MFGDHFYHAILRKTVAVFGTMFNDITVLRKDSDGIIKDIQRVPLSYGPKQKFLARLDQQTELSDMKIALKLPRMSFEITNMAYDSATKISSFNKITQSSTNNTKTSVSQMTPYIVDMQLNVIAKNQDDALQIIEQIIPYFQPTYTVSVKWIDGIAEAFDVPISLTGVTLSDDYEGDFSARRSLIYTLDFAMKIKFFGPESKKGVITTSSVDINNFDTFGFIEEITTESSFAIIGATATPLITAGGLLTAFTLTNRGRGYVSQPVVTIAPPTQAITTALANANVDGGILTSIDITNIGVYYITAPTVTISGTRLIDNASTPFTQTTSSTIFAGSLASIEVPTIVGITSIDGVIIPAPTGGPADFTATATATIADGRVDTLVVNNYGAGYITAPAVTIAIPSGTDATYTIFSGVDTTDDQQIT